MAIDLRDVAKTYAGKVQALRGIRCASRSRGVRSVRAARPEQRAEEHARFGILMTVIRPSRAAGTMLGQHLGDKETLAKVGICPSTTVSRII